MRFQFRLEHDDATPADPATLKAAAPNWQAGDMIALGEDERHERNRQHKPRHRTPGLSTTSNSTKACSHAAEVSVSATQMCALAT
jgi:hypothetical protein